MIVAFSRRSSLDPKVNKVDAVVKRSSMVYICLGKPLLHGIFHFRPILVRVSALSANNLEQMVRPVATVVLDTIPVRVCKVLLDLLEPGGCELQGFLHADHMQVNRVAGVLFLH